MRAKFSSFASIRSRCSIIIYFTHHADLPEANETASKRNPSHLVRRRSSLIRVPSIWCLRIVNLQLDCDQEAELPLKPITVMHCFGAFAAAISRLATILAGAVEGTLEASLIGRHLDDVEDSFVQVEFLVRGVKSLEKFLRCLNDLNQGYPTLRLRFGITDIAMINRDGTETLSRNQCVERAHSTSLVEAFGFDLNVSNQLNSLAENRESLGDIASHPEHETIVAVESRAGLIEDLMVDGNNRGLDGYGGSPLSCGVVVNAVAVAFAGGSGRCETAASEYTALGECDRDGLGLFEQIAIDQATDFGG